MAQYEIRHLSKDDAPGPVSIIIVNWNTRQLLRSCLSSLQDGHPNHLEVIVVDNASRDGSIEMVRQEFTHVRLWCNTHNQGFAAANNVGIQRAHGRYIVLLNSDTIVLPGALEAMTAYMDSHPRVGVLGPRLLNEDGTLQSSMREFPRLWSDLLGVLEVRRWPLLGHIVQRCGERTSVAYKNHRQTLDVDWLSGACLMLRREAIDEVGGLDTGYFFFAEEMDLCYRLRQRGWRVIFFSEAEVKHLGGQSAKRVPAARLIWHYRGILRFYRLHRGSISYTLMRAAIALTALAHLGWMLLRYSRSDDLRPIMSAYGRVVSNAIRA